VTRSKPHRKFLTVPAECAKPRIGPTGLWHYVTGYLWTSPALRC